MKNAIILLLIIPSIAFSQPNDHTGKYNQPIKYQNSLVYARIASQIEDIETNFISSSHLKNAEEVPTLDSTRTYQYTSAQDSFLVDRTILNYNPSGTLKLKSFFFWNDYLKMMLNNKYEYKYNKAGNLISVVFNEWWVYHYDSYTAPDGVFHQEGVDSINRLTTIKYTYDQSGRQSTLIHNVYDRNSLSWYNWKRTQFYYDDAGNRNSMVCISLYDNLSTIKEEYIYDVNKNLSGITQYNRTRDFVWFYSGKTQYEYIYDSESRVTSLLSSYWSFKASQWKSVSKVDYTYKANGLLESRLYAIIDTTCNELIPANKTDYKYNKIDKINLREDYAWNKTASQWELRKKQYYYYNTPDLTTNSGNSSLSNIIPFRIFPNPAKDMLRIENKSNLNSSYHIYNTKGQCVKTDVIEKGMNTINLIPLPKGIYIITIPLKNELKSCKLIVE